MAHVVYAHGEMTGTWFTVPQGCTISFNTRGGLPALEEWDYWMTSADRWVHLQSVRPNAVVTYQEGSVMPDLMLNFSDYTMFTGIFHEDVLSSRTPTDLLQLLKRTADTDNSGKTKKMLFAQQYGLKINQTPLCIWTDQNPDVTLSTILSIIGSGNLRVAACRFEVSSNAHQLQHDLDFSSFTMNRLTRVEQLGTLGKLAFAHNMIPNIPKDSMMKTICHLRDLTSVLNQKIETRRNIVSKTARHCRSIRSNIPAQFQATVANLANALPSTSPAST